MRRRISRIALSLLLGALTTIAIAWSLACMDIPDRGIWSSQQVHPTRGPLKWSRGDIPASGISVSVLHAHGRVVVWTACAGPIPQPDRARTITGGPDDAEIPPDQLVPHFVRTAALPWFYGLPWPRDQGMETRRIEASGWPALALASVSQYTRGSTSEQSWGVIIPKIGTRAIGDGFRRPLRVFPLRPLWQGFLLNTALYSTLWLSLLFALTTLRRASRRHRNLCPTCAYPRKDLPPNSPCPECGRRV